MKNLYFMVNGTNIASMDCEINVLCKKIKKYF